jgi:hypothetical protein
MILTGEPMRMWPCILPAPLILVVVATLASAGGAAAQTADSRVEVGAHASLLRLSEPFGTTNAGVGGRLSFDITRWAAVEGEATFFPSDEVHLHPPTPTLRVTYKRRRADAFVGVKAGMRRDRFGVFAKLRPGVTHLTDKGGTCGGDSCILFLPPRPEYRTELALDVGGVFEVYPTARTVTRLDVGDTIIRHRSPAPPCWSSPCTSNNLSWRMGGGFRF